MLTEIDFVRSKTHMNAEITCHTRDPDKSAQRKRRIILVVNTHEHTFACKHIKHALCTFGIVHLRTMFVYMGNPCIKTQRREYFRVGGA